MAPASVAEASAAHYTMDDVAQHDTADSCWLVISGVVYDVTEFRGIHPGGASMMDAVAGKDATDFFVELHKPAVLEEIASEYAIGVIGDGAAGSGGVEDIGDGASSIKVEDIGAVEEEVVDDSAKVTGKENQIYSTGGRTLRAESGVREVSTTGGKFTLAEVAEHNTLDDLWLAVDGKVFDITKFAADHPGGKEVLELYAGQDGSAEFNMIHHPDIIRKYGRVYEIGDVVEDHTDWTVPETEEELADRLAAYKEDGFTIFRGLYSEEQMERWRQEQNRLEEASVGMFAPSGPNESPTRTHWFGNMLERSPQLMWEAVSNPRILDFAERVLGPFVQLDNLTLAAFPPIEDHASVQGKVSGWHRDRWGRMPNGSYERPMAFNAITYLQDLTDESGPLRIVPRSHLEPIALEGDEGSKPLPGEQLVYLKRGDTIMTHVSLLHSGSPNLSPDKRYFFSVYYNISWLKHTDTFTGPNCEQLKAWARGNADHRALRLLGEDDHLQQRANSGFQQPDSDRWQQWAAEDREALEDRMGQAKM